MAASDGMRGTTRMPKLDFSAQILGVRWRVLACHRLPRDTDGDCNRDLKRVRVHPTNTAEKRCEILLHELLHAGYDHLDEEWVAQFAADITPVIYRPDVLAFLGLQRVTETQRAS